MKKITMYILALLLPIAAAAQSTTVGEFTDPQAEREGDVVRFTATYDLTRSLPRQGMILLTPVLRLPDGNEEIVFEPVLITGPTRNKVLRRGIVLGNYALTPEPSQTVVYRRNSARHPWAPVTFDLEIPYEADIRNAELIVREQVIGCRFLTLTDHDYRLLSPVLPPVSAPKFLVAYVQPPTEAVKQRSDSYAAHLNFHVNRSNILPGYMQNAAELAQVDRIVEAVRHDPNLTFNEFRVTGYASPEGTAAGNLRLSENRAKAFVNYVRTKHGIDPGAIQVDWHGDDWEGLRKLMQESTFTGRNRVLAILDGTTDPQQRKNQLKALGSIYQELLKVYYPRLRRNEYTISYIARPFSIDEAKSLIRTKPQQLSLNEMFLVANSYPKASAEFKEVFDIASRLYPDNAYANLNSGALEIEQGALDNALTRLLRVELPEAWNNIGYIYVRKGDYAEAIHYFRRAADAGLQIARDNLAELTRWLAEM